MKRNEDLVVCTDGDKDNETVIGLMEDALKCRLGAVEREMQPSKELLKKEPLENLSAVFDEINFLKLPFQQETLLVYQNEAVKEKGKKIT